MQRGVPEKWFDSKEYVSIDFDSLVTSLNSMLRKVNVVRIDTIKFNVKTVVGRDYHIRYLYTYKLKFSTLDFESRMILYISTEYLRW